jgi:protein ImuB
MTLADARTFLPSIETQPTDPLADAALLERTVRWCGRYTPWTAVDGLDGVWLDTTGCAHLFGGEQTMLDDLVVRLERLGFGVRAALADTPGVAWAVARYGVNGTVVARGGGRSALAFLPTMALRLGTGMAAGLSRLGLRCVGDLYEMPRAPLATRFGADLVRRLDQALGRIDEPISPIPEKPRYHVRTVFAEPIGEQQAIAGGLDRLIARICRRFDRGGHGCRRLEFTLYRSDGTLQQLQVGTSRPIRSPKHLTRLFASRLDTLDPGFGIEAMVLVAPVTEPLAVAQSSFSAGSREFSPREAPSCEGSEVLALNPPPPLADAELGQLIDRLNNRLGFDEVVRLAPRESFLPERAAREVAVFDKTAPCWSPSIARQPLRRPLRPLRLFARPKLVEAMALVTSRETPGQHASDMWNWGLPEEGGPPLLFRWRRVVHRVQAAEGPERIAPEWWREDKGWVSGSRDYWRVEDTDGRRFWLYREVEIRVKPAAAPRWFLHGLFA